MKAGINGILNMSVLDGWFDEAAENSGGWAIGDREPYSPERDDAHAAGIYSMFEDEIVPMYYQGREQGVPTRWMQRVKQSLRYISAHFNCQRMIQEYSSELYEPAHRAYDTMAADRFAAPREHIRWSSNVTQRWPEVRFLDAGIGPDSAVLTGSSLPLRARVDLAGLSPQDVRVEAVVGRVGARGELEETQVLTLDPLEQHGNMFLFGRDFAPLATGRLGYSVRVTPNHCDDPLNRPCNAPLKWVAEASSAG
jgi:starch phosphorylase